MAAAAEGTTFFKLPITLERSNHDPTPAFSASQPVTPRASTTQRPQTARTRQTFVAPTPHVSTPWQSLARNALSDEERRVQAFAQKQLREVAKQAKAPLLEEMQLTEQKVASDRQMLLETIQKLRAKVHFTEERLREANAAMRAAANEHELQHLEAEEAAEKREKAAARKSADANKALAARLAEVEGASAAELKKLRRALAEEQQTLKVRTGPPHHRPCDGAPSARARAARASAPL